jgi:hypothetical protein
MKLPLHSPSLIDSYPLNSLPPFTLFQGRPLMAMAAGEPPPHATRASIRAPGPPSTSLHSTPEPTPLLDVSIAPKPSSPPPPIKASRRCRCPPPRSPLSFSRSPELHRVVKKLLPTSFISLPCRVRAAARRPPATCPAPPRGASRHGRRSCFLDHPVRFPVTPAPRRTKSCPNPWPLGQDRVRRRTSGEVPAGRRHKPATRRRRSRSGDHSRRSRNRRPRLEQA